jgi:hypothetical protein
MRPRLAGVLPLALGAFGALAACSTYPSGADGTSSASERLALGTGAPVKTCIDPETCPPPPDPCQDVCDGSACRSVRVGKTTCWCDGPCPDGQSCSRGSCACAPACDGAACGGPDGCGGTCGCFGGNVCEVGRCVAAPPPWVDGSTLDTSQDRPGLDIGEPAASSPQDCATICVQNPRCDAWTYRASDSHCWIKEGAADPVSNATTVSGRVTREYEPEIDRPGNDYVDFDIDSPQSCRDACEADVACRAFTFRGGHCWLKNAGGTPTFLQGASSGFKGLESQALRFADRDTRLTTSTGDWMPGSYKAECGSSAVSGLSEDWYTKAAHAALCDDPYPARYPHQACHTVDFTGGDNRWDTSSGDWDAGYVKGECGTDEYVAGVSQRPSGFVDSILCCQGLVKHKGCSPVYQWAGESREDTHTANWDNRYVKLECKPGRYVAGVARNNRPGQPGGPDAILCCNEDETRVGPPHRLDYHGGALMTAPTTTVYYIFYGTWTQADKDVLINFAQHLAGSAYYATTSNYHDGHPWYVLNNISYGGSWDAGYFRGSGINDAQPLPSDGSAIVDEARGAGNGRSGLPDDTNGIYVILASPDVAKQSKDTSGTPWSRSKDDWCGYHTLAGPYKYAVIGRDDRPGGWCKWYTGTPTPNGDQGGGLDGMINTLAHEIFEAVTDPGQDAYKTNGDEAADLCGWDAGPNPAMLTGGLQWNLRLGNRHYLVQRLLDMYPNASYGTCEMSHYEGAIGVQSATYGANCPTWSDQTATLGARCNGQKSCSYTIQTSAIGDPAPGCAKEYTAMWTCNDGPHETTIPGEAGLGSVITLSCP